MKKSDFESERAELIHSLEMKFGNDENRAVPDAAMLALERGWRELSLGEHQTFHSAHAWLLTVAKNFVIDSFRRKSREPRLTGDMDVSEIPIDDLNIETHADLLKLFQFLSEETRNIYSLREIDGLSLKEISAITGLKAKTISQRCRRAFLKLHEIAMRDLAAAECHDAGDRRPATGDRRPATGEKIFALVKKVRAACRILAGINVLLLPSNY